MKGQFILRSGCVMAMQSQCPRDLSLTTWSLVTQKKCDWLVSNLITIPLVGL